jgi:hypothetical protein
VNPQVSRTAVFLAAAIDIMTLLPFALVGTGMVIGYLVDPRVLPAAFFIVVTVRFALLTWVWGFQEKILLDWARLGILHRSSLPGKRPKPLPFFMERQRTEVDPHLFGRAFHRRRWTGLVIGAAATLASLCMLLLVTGLVPRSGVTVNLLVVSFVVGCAAFWLDRRLAQGGLDAAEPVELP